jgi:hypothetical protein
MGMEQFAGTHFSASLTLSEKTSQESTASLSFLDTDRDIMEQTEEQAGRSVLSPAGTIAA